MASATRTPPSALDLAAASVAQRGRLLEDARVQVDRAATARATAEKAVSDAETAHAAASQASAEKRSDDALADALTRAGVRLGHARADLAAAVKAHDETTATLAAAEAGAADAQRAHELQTILAALADGTHQRELADHATAVADAIVTIRDHVLAIRARIARDGQAVARARELGAPTTLQAPDGTPAAGAFAAKLHALGGAFPGALYSLRWAFQPPTPVRPDVDGSEATATLVGIAASAFAAGARSPAGRDALASCAAWTRFRSWPEAEVALKANDAANAAHAQRVFEREHPRRMAAFRSGQKQRFDELHGGRTQSGTPEQPPKRAPDAELPEGEFVPEGAIA